MQDRFLSFVQRVAAKGPVYENCRPAHVVQFFSVRALLPYAGTKVEELAELC